VPGNVVKAVALQLAVPLLPARLCVAAVHITVTAETGTALQPVKVLELVPTLKDQVPPGFPCLVHWMVADELPATLEPGLFAGNVIVDGDAVKPVAFCA